MLNGILNIYKEKGYTSHDVVAKLRKICNQKKIGHTGTLDPEATGVLPICLGKATKISQFLTDDTKEYKTTLQLGVTTDTQDHTGSIIDKSEVDVTQEDIEKIAKSFEGNYEQLPPMFSALKVKGKKLYELARQGIEIERKTRPVHIYSIKLGAYDKQHQSIDMTVKCSKGTYIRTLCHDMGQALGCGGHMSQLTRTQVGQFRLEDSITLKELEDYFSLDIQKHLLPVDKIFLNYNAITIEQKYDKYLYNGNKINMDEIIIDFSLEDKDYIRIYDNQKQFVGLYQYIKEDNLIKPIKFFL
ncbi:tRNA pseudouridine synthase B [Natranaerovirga hydrolytica]|uniref:tRNA pseudouridine synthase B n=1 Tax=Natranaerovirga hydrolytica TaxID=680378 RepID=A0A4R1MZF5_9FIRM|nr:tRNA pseudouridine(55) synthase TruB [Natranaerovirga hydrolytica]TCK97942.1 tRNA pseudouridine synthase B [Natranaerovirga hydrolytica]